jgi:hypothetical protein
LLERGPVKILTRKGYGAGNQDKNKTSPKYTNIPSDAAIVTFDVMFDPGFEWGCKGKVGGLSIGPGKSSGCEYSANGASLRMMWYGRQGSVATPYAYVYVPTGTAQGQPVGLQDANARCGQDLFREDKDFMGKMSTGVWYTMQLGVKLNTPGQYNGELYFAFQDKVKKLGGVMWRKKNETIKQLHFNVFHGGPCLAEQNSSMQIRNVSVRPW